ERTIPITRE
nr:Chain B, Alpha-crystallin B chain [Homo sapiens]4M5T_D Chain D, Alpha-crystallin B chain [Homo sapiens]4M5T_F Chain F, Alpha-crystallin B chain [Homo sapiens]4M5T_H Chain H, Alpha-crystallin B chain [Homo sapiens]